MKHRKAIAFFVVALGFFFHNGKHRKAVIFFIVALEGFVAEGFASIYMYERILTNKRNVASFKCDYF